jgi:EmrB/QacA subfamily drug resistance transporter
LRITQDNTITPNNAKTIVLIMVCIVGFLNSTSMSVVNIAVPAIGEEFAMNASLLGWISNLVMVVNAALLIPFGRLADIFGRKKIFQYGLLMTVVSSLLCALSNSSVLFFIGRILQGFGAGMTVGIGIAIITSTFSAEERGKALGINTASVYVGIAIGPFIGGILTYQFGWRSIFFMLAILFILMIILAFWKLKREWAEAKGEKFDITGSIIIIFSIILLLYGLTVVTSIGGIISIILAIFSIIIFYLWEKRVKYPILNITLIKSNNAFVFSNLAIFLNYIGFGALVFLISLYLQYIKEFSPLLAGIILLINSVLMIIFAILSGRLSDKFQPQKIAACGLLINCIAFILFSFLNMATELWFVILCLAISGIGQGLFSTPNVKAIVSSVNEDTIGVASGIQATTRSVGMSGSTSIIILLFSLYIGAAQISPEYYPAFLQSTKISFFISAILCFIGIFVQIAGNKKLRREIP